MNFSAMDVEMSSCAQMARIVNSIETESSAKLSARARVRVPVVSFELGTVVLRCLCGEGIVG